MHFSENGNKYRILFGYAHQTNKGLSWAGRALENVHKKRILTFCNISQQVGQDNEDKPIWNNIAGDFSVRNPLDPFSKAIGRRQALANALLQLPDRSLRRAIWSHYFAMVGNSEVTPVN